MVNFFLFFAVQGEQPYTVFRSRFINPVHFRLPYVTQKQLYLFRKQNGGDTFKILENKNTPIKNIWP